MSSLSIKDMTSLRKLLLSMLVLCTLGYGSAWAFDAHLVNADSDSYAMVVNDEQKCDEHAYAVCNACDYNCHVSAHLLAIITQSDCSFSATPFKQRLETSEVLVSSIVTPDLKPPRV